MKAIAGFRAVPPLTLKQVQGDVMACDLRLRSTAIRRI